MLAEQACRDDLLVPDVNPDVSFNPPVRILRSARTEKSTWSWPECDQHPVLEACDFRHNPLQESEEALHPYRHCEVLTGGQMVNEVVRAYYFLTD